VQQETISQLVWRTVLGVAGIAIVVLVGAAVLGLVLGMGWTIFQASWELVT